MPPNAHPSDPSDPGGAVERVRAALLKLPGQPLTIARWEDREASLGWNGNGIRTAVAIQPKFVKDTAELEALGELANAAPALLAHAAQLTRERDAARAFGEDAAARYNALIARGPVLTCAFCSWEYAAGTPASGHAALTEHVMECEKHPLRASLAEAEAAIRAARDLIEDKWDNIKPDYESGEMDDWTDDYLEALAVYHEIRRAMGDPVDHPALRAVKRMRLEEQSNG
jgi:hypothetical protein